MTSDEQEFKTGYSTSIKISTMKNINEAKDKLKIPKSEVGRRILEYFFEHNDIKDLQE